MQQPSRTLETLRDLLDRHRRGLWETHARTMNARAAALADPNPITFARILHSIQANASYVLETLDHLDRIIADLQDHRALTTQAKKGA